MNSHLWWVHATLFPTTCWAMNMCELTLASHTPHRRRTGGSRGFTYRGVRFDLGGVSQLTFWRQGCILDPVIFIFYFVRFPLCNKYSDYCDIYLHTLSYYICCLLWRMYEMYPVLFLKARVWHCNRMEGGTNACATQPHYPHAQLSIRSVVCICICICTCRIGARGPTANKAGTALRWSVTAPGSESDDWPENRNWSDRNEGVGLLFARVAPRLAVVAVLLSAPSPLTDRTKLWTGRRQRRCFITHSSFIFWESMHTSHDRSSSQPIVPQNVTLLGHVWKQLSFFLKNWFLSFS
jgi:hypothetical protein